MGERNYSNKIKIGDNFKFSDKFGSSSSSKKTFNMNTREKIKLRWEYRFIDEVNYISSRYRMRKWKKWLNSK